MSPLAVSGGSRASRPTISSKICGRERVSVQFGIVLAHLAQIAVVADVVADAVLIDVAVALRDAGDGSDHLKSFQDRAGVAFAAAQVVDLGARGERR